MVVVERARLESMRRAVRGLGIGGGSNVRKVQDRQDRGALFTHTPAMQRPAHEDLKHDASAASIPEEQHMLNGDDVTASDQPPAVDEVERAATASEQEV